MSESHRAETMENSNATPDQRTDSITAPTVTPRTIGGVGLPRLRAVLGHSASAISDQGFFALGNFAVSTILARQMSETAFGQFSAAFAAFILLSTVYCPFVVDPMLVYGVSIANGGQRSYVRRVIKLHWLAALALSVVLLGIGLIRSHTNTGQGSFAAYLGWAIAAPAVLRLWFARRTAYLVVKPQYAAIAGAMYLAIIASLLFAFGKNLANNVVAACLIIGVASICVAALLHRSLRLTDAVPDQTSTMPNLRMHWRFGRWASAAGLLGLLPDYVYFFVLTPERCGEYRALLNVVLPLVQVYNALGVLMMSYFARNRERPDFNRIVLRTAGAFCVGSILMAAAAVTLGGKIFDHLYAGKYDLRFSLLLPLGIVSILFALKTVSDSVLRALESVTAMTWVAVAGAVGALGVGVPLALRFGIRGAVYGDLLVYCLMTTAVAVVWIRRLRPRRLAGVSGPVASGLKSSSCPDVLTVEEALESCTTSQS